MAGYDVVAMSFSVEL